jgi:hypothetical protein
MNATTAEFVKCSVCGVGGFWRPRPPLCLACSKTATTRMQNATAALERIAASTASQGGSGYGTPSLMVRALAEQLRKACGAVYERDSKTAEQESVALADELDRLADDYLHAELPAEPYKV